MSVTGQHKVYDFRDSLRQPIDRSAKNYLRPLTARTWVEEKRYREQQQSCSRLSQPKRWEHMWVYVLQGTERLGMEKDESHPNITYPIETSRMRCYRPTNLQPVYWKARFSYSIRN